jgi:ABC-type multidrug transport system fused ATPase/permease subunit
MGAERNTYWLSVYAGLSAVSLFAYCVRSVFLANHRLGTSAKLHEGLVEATLNAPVAFYDTTPVGKLLPTWFFPLFTLMYFRSYFKSFFI